jgi:hypothetical protein
MRDGSADTTVSSEPRIVISDAEKAEAMERIRLQLAQWFWSFDAYGNPVRR